MTPIPLLQIRMINWFQISTGPLTMEMGSAYDKRKEAQAATNAFFARGALQAWLIENERQDRQREIDQPGLICFSLTTDLSHWTEYGIDTVEKLLDYLDACVEHERRKDGYWDEED